MPDQPVGPSSSRARRPVDRPLATFFAGIALVAMSVYGFVSFTDEAPSRRHVDKGTATSFILLGGLVGAAVLTGMSFRSLRRRGRVPGRDSRDVPRTRRRTIIGFGVGLSSLVLALAGPTFYAMVGLLLGFVAAVGVIASARAVGSLRHSGRDR